MNHWTRLSGVKDTNRSCALCWWCTWTEVPLIRMNETEDLSMSTEDPPPSLNRSYDVSPGGRRTRSARSSGKRSRIRQASSTSSVPAITTAAATDGDQRLAGQDGDSQGNIVGDTSGSLLCCSTHMLHKYSQDKTTLVTKFRLSNGQLSFAFCAWACLLQSTVFCV